MRTRWVILALVILGLMTQWPSLPTFKADDYPVIAYASSWSNVAHDFVGPQYDLRFFLFYRPLITLSLAVDQWFFGVEPFGFLAMNSLACILSAVLLFLIFKRLLPGEREQRVGAALAAIWLIHPVLLHSTGWVVGRVDTHVAFWILLAIWFHLGHRRGGPAWPVWLTVCLALMTKEYALGAPLLLLGLDMLDSTRVEGPGIRFAGRRLLALPILLLIPSFLLLRKILLGAALGGYGFLEGQSLEPFTILIGLVSTLSNSLLPVGPIWIQLPLLGLVFLIAIGWIWRGSQGRAARLTGALLISAGLFAPLAPLLPSMIDPGQHRYAYMAVLWPWIVLLLCGMSFSRLRKVMPTLIVAGLLVLLIGRREDRELLSSHDRYVRSIVACLHEADEAMEDPKSPLLLSGYSELSFHPQRFLWGLGSVLKPPFWQGEREVLSLRVLHPSANDVTVDFLGRDLPGLVPIGRDSALPDPQQHWRKDKAPALVAPQGFDGVLSPAFIENRDAGGMQGWPVGEGYEGKVAVCTGFGSVLVPLPAKQGLISLTDLLVVDVNRVGERRKGANLVIFLLWNCLDLAKQSPISIYWRNSEGLQRAELRVSPDYPAWFWVLHR